MSSCTNRIHPGRSHQAVFFRRYCSNGAGAAALAALVLVSSARSLYAQPIRSEFEAVDRIVAIGDVHGAYDTFVEILKATGLVDDSLDWVGGKAHLVQTGDVLDRGPDSRKAIDLLMKLEPQAEAAGGRVHALIGNHEFFNAMGALEYVSEAELEAFDGARDRALRKILGETKGPRGLLALREAYSAAGEYGQWIRRHNAVRLAPGYSPALWRKGRWLAELGREGEAEEAFQRSIEVDPNDPGGQVGLARMLIQRGEPRPAIDRLQRVLAADPTNGVAGQLLGSALRALGEEVAARRALSLATGMGGYFADPWHEEILQAATGVGNLLRLLSARLARGEVEAVVAELERLRRE